MTEPFWLDKRERSLAHAPSRLLRRGGWLGVCASTRPSTSAWATGFHGSVQRTLSSTRGSRSTMSVAERPHRVEASVLNQTFLIDPAYRIVKGLGQGAYGCVASAEHIASGESIAIKRVSNVFNKRILTKRALREIKYVKHAYIRLLRHFRGHKNITCLYDLDITNPAAFNEIYLYEELMEADLHAIVRNSCSHRSARASHSRMPTSRASFTRLCAGSSTFTAPTCCIAI